MLTHYIHRLADYFIALEFLSVIGMVLLLYIVKAYFFLKARATHVKLAKIDKTFETMRAQQAILPLPYLKQTYLLIRAFTSWDKTHKGSNTWDNQKSVIMQNQILPNAIKYINSHDWSKRFLLLECFKYYIDNKYETIFIKLINDKFDVVSLRTIIIALRYATKPVIEAVVNKITHAHPRFQKLYIIQLHANPMLYQVINERLTTDTSPLLRQTCYRILRQIGATPQFYQFAIHDLESSDMELKLSTMPVIAVTNPTAALPILLPLLDDPNWLIRNAAIKSIGHLNKADILVPITKLLQDPSSWVRENAAKILSNLGTEGNTILETYSDAHKQSKFKEAKYFLKLMHREEN
jgi:hypothetical protein